MIEGQGWRTATAALLGCLAALLVFGLDSRTEPATGAKTGPPAAPLDFDSPEVRAELRRRMVERMEETSLAPPPAPAGTQPAGGDIQPPEKATLPPELRTRLEAGLVADQARRERLVGLLDDCMKPVIERGGSLAGLKSMIDDGTLASTAIRRHAQEALAAVEP